MVRFLTRGATPALTVFSVGLIAASAWSSRSPEPVTGLEAALIITATMMIVAIGVSFWKKDAERINAAAAASGTADAVDLARFDRDKH